MYSMRDKEVSTFPEGISSYLNIIVWDLSRDIPLGGGRLILSSRFELIVSSRQKSDR